MRVKFSIAIVVATVITMFGWTSGYAEEPDDHHKGREEGQQDIELSPELRDLLRAEMVGITDGVQTVVLALSAADWKTIVTTSGEIRASYILNKALSEAQRHELEEKLPARFKKLDQEFHERAEKMGAAAADHDPELTAFHYYRLVESCTTCHAAYARFRFPGFAKEEPAAEHHH